MSSDLIKHTQIELNACSSPNRRSRKFADREKSANSVQSKTLYRRDRRGSQRQHILGYSAYGAVTYKTSAYLCALCGKNLLRSVKEPLNKSWMNSLSPESPIAALASACNRITHALISTLERLALGNSESQSASPRLNQRLHKGRHWKFSQNH